MSKVKKPVHCCVCKKAMRINGRDCSENSDLIKPRGWTKRKNGKWLCPDWKCKNILLTKPTEHYQSQPDS